MKKSNKVVSLVLALAMSTGLMTGCGPSPEANVAESTQSIVNTTVSFPRISTVDENTNGVDAYKQIPEVKVFEPGEHVFMIRYHYYDVDGDYGFAFKVNSASISVPDGYEILDVENFNSADYQFSMTQTHGVDVWYINNETVEVAPVYNKTFEFYDYSQPGKVVEPTVSEDNSLGK